MKKRKRHRHSLSLSFQVTPSADHRPLEIHSVDCSTEGLSFLSAEALAVDSHVQVKIPMAQVTELGTKARVAYSKEDLESGLFQTGLEFDDKSKSFQRLLAEKLKVIKASAEHLEEDIDNFESEIRAELERS